jgi:hypothetical protein
MAAPKAHIPLYLEKHEDVVCQYASATEFPYTSDKAFSDSNNND